MSYAAGLAALIVLIVAAVLHRQRTTVRSARHRANVEVPNLWQAWRLRD